MRNTCAIHQPNFFPRLSTLAKLFAADTWVVLDDVQFVRRDYQNRCRLAALDDPDVWQWLSLPVHLPNGQSTRICQARLVDARKTVRRVEQMLKHTYARSPYWDTFRPRLAEVLDLLASTDCVSDVAELSTRLLLELVGWHGKLLRSSELEARPGRSERLADLARSVDAGEYLCGTGGARYLDETPFRELGIAVTYFRLPEHETHPSHVWSHANRVSALRALTTVGPNSLRQELLGASKLARPGHTG
jgi:hypothetical protein